MKPQRDNTLVDLLDRMLNKGIILNADVIISVAGVPLIGITLKAALASIETMLDYGMMEAWDESTREWYKKDLANRNGKIPLIEGETIFLNLFGFLWSSHGIIHEWRPGTWHLTNKRLFLWRKEMLFEIALDRIGELKVMTETHLNMERNVLILEHGDGVERIYVSDILVLREEILRATATRHEKTFPKEWVVIEQ
ncbi:MAG: gas vesicle protein [Candidatus Methanoperedens sp.]